MTLGGIGATSKATHSVTRKSRYRIHNGMAIFEGDIILAETPQEIEKLNHKFAKGIGIKGDWLRWPRGEIPYVIQPTLPNQDRVYDSIRHWENNTPIRFILRTDSNSKHYANYVSFVQYTPQSGENQEEVFHCSSPIGMRGGEQHVIISDQCVAGDVIHEIGHAVGLWHEQSRNDRDSYVRVLVGNVTDGIQPDGTYDRTKDMRHNFDQHVADGDNVGEYDYCSIMHYGAWFFSKNGQPTLDVIQTSRPCGNNQALGQKNGLSDGDIAAADRLYACITPTVMDRADGRLEVFKVQTDGQLSRKQQTQPGSSDKWDGQWSPLGVGWRFSSGRRPAVARNTDGTLQVFSIDNFELMYLYQYTPSGQFEGGAIQDIENFSHLGDPVVGRDANGRLWVFFVGGDNSKQLYYAKQNSASSPLLEFFHPLGGTWSPNRRPAVAQSADGRLEVFMVGLDNQVYHRWQTSPSNSTHGPMDGN